jgi:hypothetical protein
MARTRYVLTASLVHQIAAFVRAGGFPHMAAEAAGVPREVFADWLRRGQEGRGPALYRDLVHEVRQAHAQARLAAEVAAQSDRPLDWLKSGPGRETADYPGWTAPARAVPAERAPADPLLDRRVQEAFRFLLQSLAGHPEVRTSIAEQLRDHFPRRWT